MDLSCARPLLVIALTLVGRNSTRLFTEENWEAAQIFEYKRTDLVVDLPELNAGFLAGTSATAPAASICQRNSWRRSSVIPWFFSMAARRPAWLEEGPSLMHGESFSTIFLRHG